MKARKILLFGTTNLIAIITIALIVGRTKQVNKYGMRFKPNSFIMSDSVKIEDSAENIYQFYIHHYHEIYHKTAAKHHEFKLLNTDSITLGTEIYCREGESNEMLYHNYLVKEVIPNQLIYKSSEPSVIHTDTGKEIRKNYCNAFVYVDFKEINKTESFVGFTIAIQMPNYIYKLLGQIIGGKEAKEEWENHLREELDGFKEQYLLATK